MMWYLANFYILIQLSLQKIEQIWTVCNTIFSIAHGVVFHLVYELDPESPGFFVHMPLKIDHLQ